MVCIHCGENTRVTNSRLQKRRNQVWRRRQCVACQAVFTTEEIPQYTLSWIVQTAPGKPPEPFKRDKLLLSLYRSCQHRPGALDDAGGLTDTIIGKLAAHTTEATIAPRAIAQTAQVALNRFDKAASVHYRAFHTS